jgi:UDP-glucose:(heptosyl)LPS alpha-1,3-glucosyltransferase
METGRKKSRSVNPSLIHPLQLLPGAGRLGELWTRGNGRASAATGAWYIRCGSGGPAAERTRMSVPAEQQRFAIQDSDGGLRPPRVGVIIDKFDAARGGAAVYTRDLVAWLVDRCFEVHVVARNVGEQERRLPSVCHEVRSRYGGHDFAAAGSECLAALAIDVSHDMGVAVGCDVFQSHVGSPVACQMGMDAALPWWYRHARRLVQGPRRRRIRGLAAQQFGSPNSLFIAVSQRVANDLQRLQGVPPNRIRIIHNGVDIDHFDSQRHVAAGVAIRRRLGIDADDVIVIVVAHNHRLKGVHVVSHAVRRLRREGLPVRLLVCGTPQPGSSCGRAVSDWVLQAGSVIDTAPFYAAADIAVQASFYDACSLATLESLASGLPVITTRANGAAELITPGRDGIVLDDPADVTALTAALRTLAVDRLGRMSMGRAARRSAAAHAREGTFAAVVGVYAEVLASKGRTLVALAAPDRLLRPWAA